MNDSPETPQPDGEWLDSPIFVRPRYQKGMIEVDVVNLNRTFVLTNVQSYSRFRKEAQLEYDVIMALEWCEQKFGWELQ